MNFTIKEKILCFGDSLTAGYCSDGYFPYADYLSALFKERYDIQHIGLCGWTTEKMVYRSDYERNLDVFDTVWKGLQCQINNNPNPAGYECVFILSGTNDIGTDVPASNTIHHLELLVKMALKGAKMVGLFTVPECAIESFNPRIKEARAAVNAGIIDIVSRYQSSVFLVDLASALPNGADDPDGLHLSEKGSQVMAQIAYDSLKSRLDADI